MPYPLSEPFIIWAATRSGSTNLCEALGAENEPFQAGPPASRLAWVYDAWRRDGGVRPALWHGTSFKHIPEWFDDGFNNAIARNARGYRHIHLVRRDELSRLISLDVAGQLNAWSPDDARARFAELRYGTMLNALDVPRLAENARHVMRVWASVEPWLGPVLTVVHEDLICPDREARHRALRRLMAFLEVDVLADLDEAMGRGGQDTGSVREWMTNVGELREALA